MRTVNAVPDLYSRYIKYVDSPDYILDNSNDYSNLKNITMTMAGKLDSSIV